MKTAVITKVEKCPGRLLFTAFFSVRVGCHQTEQSR